MTQMRRLPWLRRGVCPVYALTIEEQQIEEARRLHQHPLETAARANHGVELVGLTSGSALFGNVEIDLHNQAAADWIRDWNAGRAVYPVTLLFEEF